MSDTLAHDVSGDAISALTPLLDDIHQAALDHDRESLIPMLRSLSPIRDRLVHERDLIAAQAIVQTHRCFPVLMEDPYTKHGFLKPRGFGGDASLIDLLYGHRSGTEGRTETGRFLFETLMRFPSCDSVRYRRGYYGAFLDNVAAGRDTPRVMALACGHLREARFSRAVIERQVSVVGIDSDPLAIAEAQRSLAPWDVDPRQASVVDFIRRRAWGETYDAVYSAGLFDYLNDKIGRKVIAAAFAALRPGGVLSVANYLTGIPEQGYMDLVMDWRLIFRTPLDMLRLAEGLPPRQASFETWVDPLDRVVYLTIRKAA